MDKGGQIALFVIVAIIIVAFFVFLFLYPRFSTSIGSDSDPARFMQSCLEPRMQETVDKLMRQGGYENPTLFLKYNDNNVQYLCFINESYKPCVVQQPLLLTHFSEDIRKSVQPQARVCFDNMKANYERQGYTVSGGSSNLNISIVPGSIRAEFNTPITITKETSQNFKKVSVPFNSQAYELLSIATSIVGYESVFGDAETTLYIQFYPQLQIQKLKRDADTIYTLKHLESNEEFTFATRSLVWPQGYGA